MPKKIKLLIVDDEARFLNTLTERLSIRDFDVIATCAAKDALAQIEKQTFDLALVDIKMPGMNGEELLAYLKERQPELEVIILTGHGSIDSAQLCTRLGAFCYLQKPCETKDLLNVLKSAYAERLRAKLKLEEAEMTALLSESVGSSPLAILRRLRAIMEKRGR